MSNEAIKLVRADRTVRGTAKTIWLLLADSLNAITGQCNPSHRTLADDAGIRRETVENALATLQRLGKITKHTRPGRSAHYELHFPAEVAPETGPLQVAPETGPHWPRKRGHTGPENGARTISNQKGTQNPPTPLPGGQRFRQSKIPTGTNPATVHLTADGRRSTRDRTLAEDLNDHSWAD